VPFQWQPRRPALGIFGNLFTFIAVPFERYIVTAIRRAQDRISDPDIAAEADAFLRQEAQHANAHRKHMQSLIGQYPALEECYDRACKSYDELLSRESLEFNLAYIANLEATFTPVFKVVLDHRESLFEGADTAVTSMLTWHFVEEIEHRSSGLVVCNHVAGSRTFRTRHIRSTFRHVKSLSVMAADAFDAHVPERDRLVSAREVVASSRAALGDRVPRLRPKQSAGAEYPAVFEDVSTAEIGVMIGRLALSQLPFHDPARQPLPQWASVWMREYEKGTDMAAYAGGLGAG
jgi:predicted metal-dependent hydrolase